MSEQLTLSLPVAFLPSPILAVHPFAPVLVLILAVMGMVLGILVLTHLVGPRRNGAVKSSPYESGMPVIGGARRRFHARFYIVALLFLLFDVEVVLLWPWAMAFRPAVAGGVGTDNAEGRFSPLFLLVSAGLFVVLLAVGLIYEWRKGAIRWN